MIIRHGKLSLFQLPKSMTPSSITKNEAQKHSSILMPATSYSLCGERGGSVYVEWLLRTGQSYLRRSEAFRNVDLAQSIPCPFST